MRARVGFPIAAKFAVMLAVLVAALLAVGLAGLSGLANLNSHVKSLYGDHILTLQRTTAVANDAGRAARISLEIIASDSRTDEEGLEAELNAAVARVNPDIEALRLAHAGDTPSERAKVEQIAGLWASFLALRTGGRLSSVATGTAAVRLNSALAGRVRAIFDPIEQLTAEQTSLETTQAAQLAKQAQMTDDSSRTLLLVIAIVASLIGTAVVALLIRAVVPRVRRYSDFALRVAAGEATTSVAVTGNDELSELGAALNEMVERRVSEQTREEAQAEFAEVMQLTETEEEAHDLLKRQIERLVHDSSVVILNRNNSADRLQATTAVPENSPLSATLENAKPRSCLSVRFARTHAEQLDRDPLIACEVCGKTAELSTCEPLLVGGEVIGSVLVTHSEALTDSDAQSIKQSVIQAAPVLANLRNLAIAERRAETDALTGLPNNRNVTDTVKRMVALASRTASPLAALALDLDHFKQINDRYGHGSGDELLAAVGSTLKSCCRESDFVGRAGGEEFLILLPDTGVEAAQLVAENIRLAVAAITIPAIERPITASIGIAVLPDHAGDGVRLLRHADRALYTAKTNGRNRTETFAREMLPSSRASDKTAADRSPAVAGNGSPPTRQSKAVKGQVLKRSSTR
jgi:diguanylate cyclase (GGDEF)-like protein